MDYIEKLATKAAEQAVNNLPDFEKEMYTADDAIYSVCGLRDSIIEDFYNEYPNKKPTWDLFEDIADDLVLS